MPESVPSPLVSVVVPTYNHAHFLREALASVMAQTYPNWEAIVVNNFSKDDTVAVVESTHEPRVRLVNFHNHGVIAASRNKGIALSSGKYIAFLDSDDKWYPEKLARCVESLEAGRDVVCHGEIWTWEDGRTRAVSYGPAKHCRYDSLLYRGNCLSTSAVVASRIAIIGAGCFSEDPAIITAEDYDLWLKLARRGHSFVILPEQLGEYRLHADNSSKAIYRNLHAVLTVLDQHFRAEGKVGPPRSFLRSRRLAQEHYVAARGFLQSGQRKEALVLLGLALRRFPFSARTVLAAAMAVLMPKNMLPRV